ncbi:MAG: hypothetical protein GWP19_14630, partial [Planctomycetia bacterium]|nr:hypothetical protein [Planctomycetia bacterium]
GKFVIYDSTGTSVVKSATFNSAVTTYISAAPLANGSFAIAYNDGGESNYHRLSWFG